jgi:Ethanolamine utilization protein EutJ (predicted chaperonin)
MAGLGLAWQGKKLQFNGDPPNGRIHRHIQPSRLVLLRHAAVVDAAGAVCGVSAVHPGKVMLASVAQDRVFSCLECAQGRDIALSIN